MSVDKLEILRPMAAAFTAERAEQPPAIHLHGAIVTPAGFFPDGTVAISGDTIREVYPERTPAGSGGRDIDTGGIICPGFIDTHNHAAYAVYRRWKVERRFNGRFDWRGKTRCGLHIVPEPEPYYRDNVSVPHGAIMQGDQAQRDALLTRLLQYGQVRGLLGGATTMVIDADFKPGKNSLQGLPGFVRDTHDWPARVWGILDVSCIQSWPGEKGKQPQDKIWLEDIQEDLAKGTGKLLIHLGEGLDNYSRGEFRTMKETKKLLTPHTALIHALALSDTEWKEVAAVGAGVIWSPTSNLRLYGRSIDIGQVIGRGIPVALAPDWTISGSSTVLDELAVVRERYGAWLKPEALLDMVTETPARIMGFQKLGRVAPGYLADLLVFAGNAPRDRSEAASQIVTAGIDALKLALIGGQAVYGLGDLMGSFSFQDQMAPEPIEVPSPAGTLSRTLKFSAASKGFAQVVHQLEEVLATQKLPIAPLWEPTALD